MEKETVRYYVIRERIPEESRKEGLLGRGGRVY